MKIICLEGCSGTGKTTQYHLLEDYYKKTKLKFLAVVEKNYEPFKSVVEAWHETKNMDTFFTQKEVKKFAKARAETFTSNFTPLEKRINIILMDRYFYTSAVYQRNCVTPKEILQINIDYGAPIPDLTLLLDCDPVTCFKRANDRNKQTGGKHLFSTSSEKVSNIREQYLALVYDREEVKIINTNRPISEITFNLINEINKLF